MLPTCGRAVDHIADPCLCAQDADIHWKEMEDTYHFSCQFTADLIAMNVRTEHSLAGSPLQTS